MRRKVFFVCILLLCAVLAAAAAEYDYTDVSMISMARDFSVDVLFDDADMPHIVIYVDENNDEVFTLNYDYATGDTDIGSWNGSLFDDSPIGEVHELIRSGKATRSDEVCINTAHFSRETDWFLVYSTRRNSYTEYSERNFAQAFDAMGTGGIERSLYYRAGQLSSARIMKRSDSADLLMYYNKYGEMTDASVYLYRPTYGTYDYDPSTGLFGGKTITELGFEEADLEILPFTSLETRTETTTTTSVAVSVPGAEARSPVVFAGSLLTGILIGVALVTRLRRRMKERKAQKEKAAADAASGAAESPEFIEPPRTMSSGR